ncbi:hypothetical protein K470DRAFT_220124 [Piedraia hortae CBS 480.64]|uniref:uS12 prolyl 3,4-dihydroxylase n=1 Tax=Piedraia hortae CBS 480.64 TaxID=1314780 RepID=A0A6A7BV15_9PEZI|nr:hypothetical protein K470DRAFT_220124 [Piedraia hortae CBS 480.64]
MKRKTEDEEPARPNKAVDLSIEHRFSDGLFDEKTVLDYAASYAASEPYKHAVVSKLIDDTLLRNVRHEVLQNIHFTPKETDIYKIHQSGDLANLDGLDPTALKRLPSLLKLRDALYSREFRHWISRVSGSGPLSGQKTDMAVNIYVPGCHLLCHDDVIGSRRVSYILYLTNPDDKWGAKYGGSLRLYPVDKKIGDDGKTYKIPSPEWTVSIPPAWNQLSFFAVQPGESFHDVEEVYHGENGDRMRMAISGWFHVPQEGEEGYERGLEEKLSLESSLLQLQNKDERFEKPRINYFIPQGGSPGVDFTELDFDYLRKFMTPSYLTPDTVDELTEVFTNDSAVQLAEFFNPSFAQRLKTYIQTLDNKETNMQVAVPPYKHRFQYISLEDLQDSKDPATPLTEALDLLSSLPFKKWLSHATDLTLNEACVVARRFRRGLDYQLAQRHGSEETVLEYTLNLTPTTGWDNKGQEVGGYEMYMAADEEVDEVGNAEGGAEGGPSSHTGAGDRPSTSRKAKNDPAVYKADDDGDDGILFTYPASWNTLSLVLRDRGTMRFVKYVSKAAPGDRWDCTGAFGVLDDGDSEGEESEGESE